MKTTKKDRAAFHVGAVQIIKRHGGILLDGEVDRYELTTPLGLLTLFVESDYDRGVGTVFARFDNPQQARTRINCNAFSGKWNHHFFPPTTVANALYDFGFELYRVTGNYEPELDD